MGVVSSLLIPSICTIYISRPCIRHTAPSLSPLGTCSEWTCWSYSYHQASSHPISTQNFILLQVCWGREQCRVFSSPEAQYKHKTVGLMISTYLHIYIDISTDCLQCQDGGVCEVWTREQSTATLQQQQPQQSTAANSSQQQPEHRNSTGTVSTGTLSRAASMWRHAPGVR